MPHFSESTQTPSQFSGSGWADSSGMRSRKTRAGPSSGASSRQLSHGTVPTSTKPIVPSYHERSPGGGEAAKPLSPRALRHYL